MVNGRSSGEAALDLGDDGLVDDCCDLFGNVDGGLRDKNGDLVNVNGGLGMLMVALAQIERWLSAVAFSLLISELLLASS